MTKREALLSVDDLAGAFDMPSWERIEEANTETIFEEGHNAAREVMREDGTEDEIEDARDKAERGYLDHVYSRWSNAVGRVSNEIAAEHGLELLEVGRGHYRLVPGELAGEKYTWQDAAQKNACTNA